MNVLDAPNVIDVANGQFRTLLEDWLPMNLDTQGQQPILLLNHPTLSSSPQNVEYGIDDFAGDRAAWLAAMNPRVPLINIINGPSDTEGTDLPPGDPSEGEFRRYLNFGLHVAPTADQDNHQRNWGNATQARTAIVGPSLLVEDVRRQREADDRVLGGDLFVRQIGEVTVCEARSIPIAARWDRYGPVYTLTSHSFCPLRARRVTGGFSRF